ncbi:hypothetical protein G5S_0291 [Chlamydia pecorum E58]|uniref:Uncharacterized protein n=1 Tax=Chlamydia pecorum (strain ATCC VR-628 / DSM 29919 / E58) TaxID=331635 RepID=A0AA34RCN9_CHLPE|nr:hypothetical protein G5S_0291 [Chlamydia pecorum E58]
MSSGKRKSSGEKKEEARQFIRYILDLDSKNEITFSVWKDLLTREKEKVYERNS